VRRSPIFGKFGGGGKRGGRPAKRQVRDLFRSKISS